MRGGRGAHKLFLGKYTHGSLKLSLEKLGASDNFRDNVTKATISKKAKKWSIDFVNFRALYICRIVAALTRCRDVACRNEKNLFACSALVVSPAIFGIATVHFLTVQVGVQF